MRQNRRRSVTWKKRDLVAKGASTPLSPLFDMVDYYEDDIR
jgi:hypothetical protein